MGKLKTRTRTQRTSNSHKPQSIESRVLRVERQIEVLQLVIRELTGFTDAVAEDVDDLLDEQDDDGATV